MVNVENNAALHVHLEPRMAAADGVESYWNAIEQVLTGVIRGRRALETGTLVFDCHRGASNHRPARIQHRTEYGASADGMAQGGD